MVSVTSAAVTSTIKGKEKRNWKKEELGCVDKKYTVLTSQEPSPAKRRRKISSGSEMGLPPHPGAISGYIELNVGYALAPTNFVFTLGRGKIFATTFGTLTREISLLSVYVSGGAGTESLVTYDKEGRIFIDRDPTHFRWLLNYLRYLLGHSSN